MTLTNTKVESTFSGLKKNNTKKKSLTTKSCYNQLYPTIWVQSQMRTIILKKSPLNQSTTQSIILKLSKANLSMKPWKRKSSKKSPNGLPTNKNNESYKKCTVNTFSTPFRKAISSPSAKTSLQISQFFKQLKMAITFYQANEKSTRITAMWFSPFICLQSCSKTQELFESRSDCKWENEFSWFKTTLCSRLSMFLCCWKSCLTKV